MKPLGIGVIGCGEIASTYHLPALARVRDARITAVADVNGEAAGRAASDYRATAYTEADLLLADPDVEAVLILTPNFTRVETVSAAADAGKAMMVQKPLARNLEECETIMDRVESAGILTVPSYMHRYFPEVLKAKELIGEGVLGDIRTVRVRNGTPGSSWTSWFFNREMVGGGAAIDIGVHGIDLVRWLVGEIQSVYATTKTMVAQRIIRDEVVVPDNEDTVVATYHLDNGAICVHEVTWAQYQGYGRFEMEIYGSDGTILIRSGMGPLAVASRHLEMEGQWLLPDLPRQFLGVVHHQDFVDAVRQGPSVLTATPEDGVRGIEVVNAIYWSAESGARVDL
jgi:predicted dehydrogenase